MRLVWFLVSFCLLATTSSFAGQQEYEQGLNHSTLHLTLYRVLGHGSPLTSHSPPSISELVSRDQARVKHLNSRLTENRTSSVNLALSIGTGNYYVYVGLGTPPSYYPVFVDTGSSFSWVQCQPCDRDCDKQVVPIFNTSASGTYKRLSCKTPECNSLQEDTLNPSNCTYFNECVYTASYAYNSNCSGYLSQDSLSLTPSETLPGFVFGCGQNNSGSFNQSAGLFGLARNNLSMISQLSFKYGYAFSYCLPTGSGVSGGSLSIGRDSLMGSSYKFTPMLTNPNDSSLYGLNLTAIVVAGRTLGVAAAEYYQVPTIIDSGTTFSSLPPSVYAALRDEFTKIMSSKYDSIITTSCYLDTCYKGSLNEMSLDVPEVRMVFQGEADLTLAPQSIIVDGDEEGTTVCCLAFASMSGDDKTAIIGSVQQQPYNVAYDVSNLRIGFAAGGCS